MIPSFRTALYDCAFNFEWPSSFSLWSMCLSLTLCSHDCGQCGAPSQLLDLFLRLPATLHALGIASQQQAFTNITHMILIYECKCVSLSLFILLSLSLYICMVVHHTLCTSTRTILCACPDQGKAPPGLILTVGHCSIPV